MFVAGDPLTVPHVPLCPCSWCSNIRETMVRIMTGAHRIQPESLRYDSYNVDEGENLDVCEPTNEWQSVCEDSRSSVDPSSCVFWCSVALGALAQGRPLESVSCPVFGRATRTSTRHVHRLSRQMRLFFERYKYRHERCSPHSRRWIATSTGRITRSPPVRRPQLPSWPGASSIPHHRATLCRSSASPYRSVLCARALQPRYSSLQLVGKMSNVHQLSLHRDIHDDAARAHRASVMWT